MKKLILSELLLLFLATTFMTDSLPPGWYQQTLPVNDQINDIFFIDSLNGWVVTNGNYNANDTSYIMHTTDGGNNWIVQEKNRENLTSVQFLDINTGYTAGGANGTVAVTLYKTTNGGGNWLTLNNIGGTTLEDIYFVNLNTGWVCDDNSGLGGLYRTTNGGINWQQQLGASYTPDKLFFLNKDTGWVKCNTFKIFRTINSGINWTEMQNFPSTVIDIFFSSKDTGWIVGGKISGPNLLRTTNGGFNWDTVNNAYRFSGSQQLFFINNTKGWVGSGPNVIVASVDGNNWGSQYSPSFLSFSVHFADSLNGWAGTSFLVHTTDGGGPINAIQQISNEVPTEFKLYQNYPNPFNPSTKIKASLAPSKGGKQSVKLMIYNITGKEIAVLINEELSAGTYEVDFDGTKYSSGVYFYSLIVDEKLIDTKKMILIK